MVEEIVEVAGVMSNERAIETFPTTICRNDAQETDLGTINPFADFQPVEHVHVKVEGLSSGHRLRHDTLRECRVGTAQAPQWTRTKDTCAGTVTLAIARLALPCPQNGGRSS